MTKNANTSNLAFEKESTHSFPTSINAENPLKKLKKFQKNEPIQYPTIGQLSASYREKIELLFWTHNISSSLPILWKISKPVFTEEFNHRIRSLLWDYKAHLDWLDVDCRRSKQWGLEVLWDMHDIPATEHHLIPRSRGWINHERNYLRLPWDTHSDLHYIFGTLTPIEQIAHIALCLRKYYDPKLMSDLCEILQNQNNHYESILVKNSKIVYPPAIWGFIRNLHKKL